MGKNSGGGGGHFGVVVMSAMTWARVARAVSPSAGGMGAETGADSISSTAAVTLPKPGPVTAGGMATPASGRGASHWLLQSVTVDLSSGPFPPANGQLMLPDPASSQGAQEDFWAPCLSL